MTKSQGGAEETAPCRVVYDPSTPCKQSFNVFLFSQGVMSLRGPSQVGVFLADSAWPLWAVDQEGFLVEARWGQLNCCPTPGYWELAVPGSQK